MTPQELENSLRDEAAGFCPRKDPGFTGRVLSRLGEKELVTALPAKRRKPMLLFAAAAAVLLGVGLFHTLHEPGPGGSAAPAFRPDAQSAEFALAEIKNLRNDARTVVDLLVVASVAGIGSTP